MRKPKKHLNSGGKERPAENYFPAASELLEQAFRTTSKLSVSRKGITPIKVIRNLNSLKIHTFGEFLYNKLNALSKEFPHMEKLDPFYLDLVSILADAPRLKKNLSKVNASARIIKKLRFMYNHSAYAAVSIKESNKALNSFQGRVSSVMKKLTQTLKELKHDSKRMKELPSINFELPTVVLAGYPNVGKTTLLKRLTGSSAQISPYAFTTKQINTGYFEINYSKIQVLDTPGLLDREEVNAVEKKAIAAINHLASVIVFILDPTLACGYTLQEQVKLLEHTKERFLKKKIIIVLNKVDLADGEELNEAKEALKEFTDIIFDSEKLQTPSEEVKKQIGKTISLT